MGTFRITVEIADPLGQHFEAVEMLVDTGATFTKAPRDLLERLGVALGQCGCSPRPPLAASCLDAGAVLLFCGCRHFLSNP